DEGLLLDGESALVLDGNSGAALVLGSAPLFTLDLWRAPRTRGGVRGACLALLSPGETWNLRRHEPRCAFARGAADAPLTTLEQSAEAAPGVEILRKLLLERSPESRPGSIVIAGAGFELRLERDPAEIEPAVRSVHPCLRLDASWVLPVPWR